MKTGHAPNWDNVKLLDRSSNFKERRIREALHITMQLNPLNVDEGMELPPSYKALAKPADSKSNKFRAKLSKQRLLPNF